jgi:formimidoylglutamate deiminase
MTRLEPELIWLDGRFRRGMAVVVDPASGRIHDIVRTRAGDDSGAGPSMPSTYGAGGPGQGVPLPGRALVPGFVNAHSHAFQRLIRGRTQTRPADDRASDFWAWREAMYTAALSLSAEDVHDVARFCFLEMMRTGITAVGEFHYLHHQPDGKSYPDRNELALGVIAAAEDVGLRIALLNVCYATGGIGRRLEDRQRRFRAASLDGFLERTGRLFDLVQAAGGVRVPEAGLVTVGVAPHSIRAVPRDWLPPLREWAVERDVPLHMHVAERPEEVEACSQAYGRRPMELLAEDGILDDRFTAIHGIHLTDAEVSMAGEARVTVCACPTTERGLGDGFVRSVDLLDSGARLALGTDSHTNLDFLEEMRLIEHHERLQRLERVVITDAPRDGHHHVAPELLDMATIAGARALRLDAGEIAAGRLADLIAIDLDHIALAGWSDDTLAAMLTLSVTPDVVSDVWIGGRRRLEDRRHAREAGIVEAFRAVAAH